MSFRLRNEVSGSRPHRVRLVMLCGTFVCYALSDRGHAIKASKEVGLYWRVPSSIARPLTRARCKQPLSSRWRAFQSYAPRSRPVDIKTNDRRICVSRMSSRPIHHERSRLVARFSTCYWDERSFGFLDLRSCRDVGKRRFLILVVHEAKVRSLGLSLNSDVVHLIISIPLLRLTVRLKCYFLY
jgi:hypothetical protein